MKSQPSPAFLRLLRVVTFTFACSSPPPTDSAGSESDGETEPHDEDTSSGDRGDTGSDDEGDTGPTTTEDTGSGDEGGDTTCPTTGLIASSGVTALAEDCEILGDVVLSGDARLTMDNATLAIHGNLSLSGNAEVVVTSGTLHFPQTSFAEYAIELIESSSLTIDDSMMKTSTDADTEHLPMSLDAADLSSVTLLSATLDTGAGDWLLGNFRGQSTLSATSSTDIPSEVYPSESAAITLDVTEIASVWLDFTAGDAGTIDVPSVDASGRFTLEMCASGTSAWCVVTSDTKYRLGLNSHPSSSLTVNGAASNPADIVLGYFIENPTEPVTLTGLVVDQSVSTTFSDSGRTLALNDVYLNPFAWQVYVSESAAHPVTIVDSKINELAGFANGVVDVMGGVHQLANLAAAGPGSVVTCTNCDIWTNAGLAMNGGTLDIVGGAIHGNAWLANGAGSTLTFSADVVDEQNGAPAQADCAPVGGYPPHDNGTPLCHGDRPIHACSIYQELDGGVIAQAPACR